MGLSTYIAASINFSIILFKILGQGDPRNRFSGNAGTTNVSRQLGKFWGAVVLLLDLGRAAAIAQVGVWFLPAPLVPVLGLVLVIGNQKPLFHGFRGGKGVAGYLGFTAFLSPVAAGVSCLAWVLGLWGVSRSLYRVFFYDRLLGSGDHDPLRLGLAGDFSRVGLTMALIFWAHKSNVVAFKKK